MGLSAKTKANLSGRYSFKSDTEKRFTFSVLLLARVDQGNYADEKSVYDSLETVMDDIVTWIHEVAHTKPECFGGIVSELDLDNMSFNRVGPYGSDNAHGWELQLLTKTNLEYDYQANPLRNLITSGL